MSFELRGRFTIILFVVFSAPFAIAQTPGDVPFPPEPKPLQANVDQQKPAADQQDAELEKQVKLFLEIKPIEVLESDDELRKLLKERFNTAIEMMQHTKMIFDSGLATFDQIAESGKMVLTSGLDLLEAPQERVQLLTNYLAVAKMYESGMKIRFEGATEDAAVVLRATYHRLEVEILLLKEKRKIAAKSTK